MLDSMKAVEFPSASISKRVFAGLLAVWLSGAVFLLCCGSIKGQESEIDSCPLAKLGHCDKSAVNEDTLRIQSPGEDCAGIDCCAFLPQLFQKVRKSENSQQIALLPVTSEVKAVPIAFGYNRETISFDYRPRLLNRRDTYLKNRVFRI